MKLLYVMDPMCAWCYGFQPELEALINKEPAITVEWVMGGLAPDSQQPMSEQLKKTIAHYWYQIEQYTKVTFNHDYWLLNTPYRSTYQACRAVLSAESLLDNGAEKMVKAIQFAYYQQAKNPSLDEILLECAKGIGIDTQEFWTTLNARETENQFQRHLRRRHGLQVVGFPALYFIDNAAQGHCLTDGFCESVELVNRLKRLKQQIS